MMLRDELDKIVQLWYYWKEKPVIHKKNSTRRFSSLAKRLILGIKMSDTDKLVIVVDSRYFYTLQIKK